ncbi:MAG: hypothetical protein ABF876_11720 [Acetobacter aceti]|uniref:hypothetical protein n=1 Tax=Acetobacter aceti TaxID=435 RepID=UPI001F1DB161|nr:hypothetical protein [Acetobacter aceti]
MTVLVDLVVRALEGWGGVTADVLAPKGTCVATLRVLFDFMDAAKATIGVSMQDASRRKIVGKPLEFRNSLIENLSISKSDRMLTSDISQVYRTRPANLPTRFTSRRQA